MARPDSFTIQAVIAPDYDRPPRLYLNDPDKAPGCRGDLPWTLTSGDVLCTNTYLNALFTHVWEHNAQLGRIGLRVDLEGDATIEVLAVLADDVTAVVETRSGPGQHIVWLDEIPEHTVRLFCQITASSALCITHLSWITDQRPLRSPTLSIGICTFNREPFLAQTLSALVQQIEQTPAIQAIWVVNQGATFTDPDLLAHGQAKAVHIVEQPNLGGCGGFTRSMLESVSAANPTTHHILMDDDIVLDPRVLERVVRFLAFSHDNIALGGQMLEIEKPTRLHEAGGRLHPLWFVESLGKSLEMDHPTGLHLFNETLDAHFNAWWFCVIPTDAIRSIGLPPPLFIRGDDMEYCCRMREAGIQILPLPGCVVWHESFAYKTSDWLHYYDLRNRLILAALHPDEVAPPDALYLLGFTMTILFQHRYRATRVVLLAIEDSVKAPVIALGPDSAARHEAMMSWLNQFPEPQSFDALELPETDEGHFIPLDPSIPAMVKMCVTGFIGQHLARLLPRRKLLKFTQLPQAPSVLARNYVAATNPECTRFTLYRSDLQQLWVLLFKTVYTCLRYQTRSKKMAAVYRHDLDVMRTEAQWKRSFDSKR